MRGRRVAFVVGGNRLDGNRGRHGVSFGVSGGVEPYNSIVQGKPQSPIGALYGCLQWAHLVGDSWKPLAPTYVVAPDPIARVLQGLGNFHLTDVEDSGNPVNP